jgi:hypothetical protein
MRKRIPEHLCNVRVHIKYTPYLGISCRLTPIGASPLWLPRKSPPLRIDHKGRFCYSKSMETIIATQALLTENQLSGRGLIAVLAPHAARNHMLVLAARLSLRGALQVLDAGNRFNAYEVARHLRREGADKFEEALAHIHVARSFTPYQLLALLESIPGGAAPTLVLDLLNTFYDESLPHSERVRLLKRCLTHLRRLSDSVVVVASVRPPRPPEEDPQGLVERVREAADEVLFFEELLPPQQPKLF